ncbi:Vegetative incompatibility protein HET-E-1 [Ceratocystis fimbriata CBS 114723]|uniref:Vegetative incompatibility protein HET-E-1 n=1 Tax=Ceratocystis fimbriata CBS 114723 TaxID=1035309 RepID=A0A2C5X0Y4_9PEZI|nr:Vegetative incompatibility protein HET-E-1 [Ceratocystis fimbriata CBS 114723]
MPSLFHKARTKVYRLFKASNQYSGSATSLITSSSGPVQSLPTTGTPSPPPAPEPKPAPLASIQENVWRRAYDDLRKKDPELVKAFETIVHTTLHLNEKDAESSEIAESKAVAAREVSSREMQQIVRDGINRTKNEASLKQEISDGLQAVHAIRGLMDSALRTAPEAAVVWATVCLGIEILSNPVTEALENRKGIQYVLCRMEWYWNLADLLLDENKGETATTSMRDELEKDIVRLFEKLLLYQMKSICLYHRSRSVTFVRDLFQIDDWGGQLSGIKEAEEAVRYDIEQYNSQESQIQLQKLNDTADALQQGLQSITTAVKNQTECLHDIHAAAQDQAEQQAKRHEEDKDKQCLSELYVTDPRIDKKDIEEKKGGLLKASYQWILEHTDFRRFQTENDTPILWIKGDPGKGKTMLLCGIIDELELDPSASLSYFFCQATGGDRLSSATSVLRGLIYYLVRRNPQLVKHVRIKYDYMGKKLFDNEGAWHDLCEIMTAILNDPSLENVVLIVDALDECSVDRKRLLDFIARPSPAKWIVSSRNWIDIEEVLDHARQKIQINLETNRESVSLAVESYLQLKVDQLAQERKYKEGMKANILRHLRANADGTFLWVALVCQELSNVSIRKRHTLDIVKSLPPGLAPLYSRMLEHISQSKDAQICGKILSIAAVTYRPITLEELRVFVEELEDLELEEVKEIIESCGSFLTVHRDLVSFVHQSAKEYLLSEAPGKILPYSIAHQHQMVFLRSLDLLCGELSRDIYGLQAPGYLIDQVSIPEPDPLASLGYSCLFWVDHLRDSTPGVMASGNDRILDFFKEYYLQWLEALSLLRSVSVGVRAMDKLEIYLKKKASQELQEIIKDARRFLLSHRDIVEVAPLQVQEELSWIELKPRIEADWDACLQTLEGHGRGVTSAVLSNDGLRLASGSRDNTVKVWDATSGACLQTLQGHDDWVRSVAFSEDGRWLASGSDDKTVKIWDAARGTLLQTLEGHGDPVISATFSKDGRQIVSGSYDKTVKIWDVSSAVCLQTFTGHDGRVMSVAFSSNGQQVASGSRDKTVMVWDATSGVCLQTLKGHDHWVRSVVFSEDGQRLASGSDDKTIKVWDTASGTCLQTLEGHGDLVSSVTFSNDEQQLASASNDKTIKIWDATSSTCLQTLEGHDLGVTSVVLSENGQQLVSGSDDGTVKIWDVASDVYMRTSKAHNDRVASMTFSDDKQRLVSGSRDNTIKIWDATSGACLQTLEGHNDWVRSVTFSRDGQRLASGSRDRTVKIWDATSSACLQTLNGHSEMVASVAFSTDGQRLASGSRDKTVRIWDATSGTCQQKLEGHDGWVSSVMFSNDGKRLASGSHDNTIKIWDATSGACLQTFEGHDDWVRSVAFSEDGQRLASGSYGKVKIWHASSGVCLQTLLIGGAIRRCSFDPLDDSLLSTNIGVLDLDMPVSAAIPSTGQVSLLTANIRGYGVDGPWIMKDGQRIILLPPGYHYHSMVSDVSDTRVGLGFRSGRVLVIGFRSA